MDTNVSLQPQEWTLLADAPLAAATAVALADAGGAQRELQAIFNAWRTGAQFAPDSVVLQRLVTDFDPQQREQSNQAAQTAAQTAHSILDEAVTLCQRAILLLEQRAPAEVEPYRRFVLHIADAVAQAESRGGFLGIGGVPVTLEEQAVLRAIRVAIQA